MRLGAATVVYPDDGADSGEISFVLLEPDLRQLTLPQGVICYRAGDPIDQVYFPHTGMISQLITTGDGDMASRSPALRDLIVRYTETVWAEAQQNAACNAIHEGSSRLCRWLLQCADRTGSEQLLLTQEFLSEMLGVRRTTVKLLAQELQKRGILRYSRGRITILDRPALEASACECYEAVKQQNLSQRIGIKL